MLKANGTPNLLEVRQKIAQLKQAAHMADLKGAPDLVMHLEALEICSALCEQVRRLQEALEWYENEMEGKREGRGGEPESVS